MSLTLLWPEIDVLLDTNVISAYLDDRTNRRIQLVIQSALRRYRYIGIPVVACGEAHYGIEFSSNLHATYDDFFTHLGDFPIVPVTASTVESYQIARQAMPLESKRLNDTWIAASALQHQATVLTGDNDFDDFAKHGVSVHKISIT